MRHHCWVRLGLISAAVLCFSRFHSAQAASVIFDFHDAATNIQFNGTLGRVPFHYTESSSEGPLIANFTTISNDLRIAATPPLYGTNLSGAVLQERNSAAVHLDIAFNSFLNAFSIDFALDAPKVGGANKIKLEFFRAGNRLASLTQNFTGAINSSSDTGTLSATSPNPARWFDEVLITTTAGSGSLALDDIDVNPVPELSPGVAMEAFALLSCALAIQNKRRKRFVSAKAMP